LETERLADNQYYDDKNELADAHSGRTFENKMTDYKRSDGFGAAAVASLLVA